MMYIAVSGLIIVISYVIYHYRHSLFTSKKVDTKKVEEQQVIVKFRGNEYNITDFVKDHPGGKQVLLENNGNDVEELMLENKHSVVAYDTLETYKIKLSE